MKRHELGVTPRADDFSAWYNELVVKAQLVDRGPAKGTMVIRPYGYRVWELLQAELDTRIKATGHENAYFPLLIPESYLHREAKHVEGFSPELAVVTVAGGKKLEEPLVVRPTSETIVGEMMSKWVTSHRDLPLLLNQWSNVVRWELRPRMFLRTTEFLWQEGHTAHADQDDAMAETTQALDLYTEVAQGIAAIPVVPGEKTPGERFAGAVRTFTVEGMMGDGRALQAGTAHYMGTNFAEAFGISFTDDSGRQQYTHTTSWGMTTRMIGAIVMTHGDDKGLVLPPALAPHQVVIVTVGKENGDVRAAAGELAERLRNVGVRVHLDDREHVSPGFKFNHWELLGVPIRLEIGPRDLTAGTVVMSLRIEEGKKPIRLDEADSVLASVLDEVQDRMYSNALAFQDDRTSVVDEWAEFVRAVSTGWAMALHCGRQSCEDDIKAETASTARCVPSDAPAASGTCIKCDQPSVYGKRVIFGRAY